MALRVEGCYVLCAEHPEVASAKGFISLRDSLFVLRGSLDCSCSKEI